MSDWQRERWMARGRSIRAIAALATAVILLLPAGCVGRRAPWSPVSTPTGQYPLLTPAPDCPSASNGELLDDVPGGFALRMPGNWRNLRPGDAGWVTLYGSHGSDTEQAIGDGEIQDFAVPLEPPDEDRLVTMAVYIDAAGDMDLAEEGANYGMLLLELGGKATSRNLVTLPAGDAVVVVGSYPYGDSKIPMFVAAYMLYHDGARYSLVLVSREKNAATYAAVAACMATSLVFTGPAPTARPTLEPEETSRPDATQRPMRPKPHPSR